MTLAYDPMKTYLMTLLSLLLFSSLSPAQVDDFLKMHSEPGSLTNARAMAMGNAYSTFGYDFSAVRFNPATLAVADSLTFSFGINYNVYPNSAEYQSQSIPFTTSNTALSQFGMTFPISTPDRRAVLAAGYTVTQDLNRNLKFNGYNSATSTLVQDLTSQENGIVNDLALNYPVFDTTGAPLGMATILTGGLQQDGYIVESGSVVNLSAGISTETARNVFFGASANYTIGTWTSDREFTETDVNDVYGAGTRTVPSDQYTADFQSLYYHDVRDVVMKGFELRLGLLYKFFDFISIGGSYKLSTPHTLSETITAEGTSRFASGKRSIVEPDRNFSYTVAPAPEITLGASVNLWIITAMAEATFVDYTQITYSDGPSTLQTSLYNKQAVDTYSRVLNLNGGAEFRLPFTGLSARAGFMYRPSPYKTDKQEFDKKYLTLGVGMNSGGWLAFDVAYGYGWWKAVYRGSGQTFAGVIQNVQVHDVLTTIKVTVP